VIKAARHVKIVSIVKIAPKMAVRVEYVLNLN
jgi:hypothetical protein